MMTTTRTLSSLSRLRELLSFLCPDLEQPDLNRPFTEDATAGGRDGASLLDQSTSDGEQRQRSSVPPASTSSKQWQRQLCESPSLFTTEPLRPAINGHGGGKGGVAVLRSRRRENGGGCYLTGVFTFSIPSFFLNVLYAVKLERKRETLPTILDTCHLRLWSDFGGYKPSSFFSISLLQSFSRERRDAVVADFRQRKGTAITADAGDGGVFVEQGPDHRTALLIREIHGVFVGPIFVLSQFFISGEARRRRMTQRRHRFGSPAERSISDPGISPSLGLFAIVVIQIQKWSEDLRPLQVGGELHGSDLAIEEELVGGSHGADWTRAQRPEPGREFEIE